MNQPENAFGTSDVAPNPFVNGPDHGAIPTIPGFEMNAAKKAPINIHGVLTLGILCIAGVAIWGMRSIGLKGLQAGVHAPESASMMIDAGARPPAVMTVEDQRLLADLNASRTDRQIPGEELQKNPFSLSDATRPRAKTTPGAPLPKSATPEEVRAARQQELLASLADYRLQGVMGGSTGVARINGKPYRVGDTLGGKPGNVQEPRFTITAIDGREVTVSHEDFSFILSMDQ
ncbi:MAG TPA: hypothetical protein VEB22_11065 [Phycisphaerales bacterium]|nr:hypothetical protein [Phycisphaerales bacterium]